MRETGFGDRPRQRSKAGEPRGTVPKMRSFAVPW